MPLYEYECLKCHRKTEKIETVAGPHLKKCPHCGGKVEQSITAPSIQFKGSGWYVTDYAGKSPAKESAGEKGSNEKSSTEKSESESGEKKESASKENTNKESTAKESKDSADKKTAKKK